nr:hypothetical protein [Tanacetum cinerariifolium]
NPHGHLLAIPVVPDIYGAAKPIRGTPVNSALVFVFSMEKVVSGPGFNYSNIPDSSVDSPSVPSKVDFDNLFGPLYEEYFASKSSDVFNNSAANTLDKQDTLSSSSIVVEQNDVPPQVTSSEEPIQIEPSTLVSNVNPDE